MFLLEFEKLHVLTNFAEASESIKATEKASNVKSVEIVESRIETERQFYDYYFTHNSSLITHYHLNFFKVRISIFRIVVFIDPKDGIKLFISNVGDVVGVPDGHVDE